MGAVISPLGVRLPADLKEKIKETAAVNKRSMNAEIAFRLAQSYQTETKKADAMAS